MQLQARPSLARSRTVGVRCSTAPAVCPRLVQQASVMAAVGSAWQQRKVANPVEDLKQQLKGSVCWMAGAVLPFASAVAQPASQAAATAEIYGAIAKVLDIYLLVLTLRVILTWFRTINWLNEPFATLRQFTDPFLNTFRGILPSFGGIDVSPMIGFFILNFVRNQLVHLSRTMIL
ncbi:hypothetical protein HXX76_006920 [Chlamydomonas incerta]|uniref:Uncharacterized protein n=1 Tax=Chlamydomonas incerta TaxID=51695 RepID=A0A835T482_CHLIN|nr:hypothetical protein HXX76_006920 [Chlamydomonas incerta]|eukprot:KAG2435723.1 hypothetical protein HXX76_006920 [Chlamydomonas incerta]